MGVQSVQLTSTGFIPNTTGLGKNLSQQTPEFSLIQTSDTLATVVTTGYLNQSHTYFQYPYMNGQMALVSTTDQGDVWLRIAVTTSGGVNTYSLVYPAGEEGSAVSYTGTLTVGHLIEVQSASGVIEDAGIAVAEVMQLNIANAMAAGASIALDKGVGTESAHAVTINKQAGVITTTSLTTAGGATETFTLNNTEILTTSVILVTVGNGSNTATDAFSVIGNVTGAGTASISVTNNTAATALNGTLVISFGVF